MKDLTKIEVAKFQLATAINLFFDSEDPVSIYTLAANAWEIIDTLCSKSNTDSISNQTRGHISGQKNLRRDYVNSPFRNYFKHADRDVDTVLMGFSDTKNDHLLFLAVEDYIRLNEVSPVEFQVYQLWYLALYFEKLSSTSEANVLAAIENEFPCIRTLPRFQQKHMAKASIARARADKEVMSDPRTEGSLRSKHESR